MAKSNCPAEDSAPPDNKRHAFSMNTDLHPQYFAGQFSFILPGAAVIGDQLQLFFRQVHCIPAGDDPAGKIGTGSFVNDAGFRAGLSQELF